MSSYTAAGNLFTELSINIQHRLCHLQWLRRTGARCFSHHPDSSGLPVRYIPKKHREVNKTQHDTSVDISPNDGIPSSSDSSTFRHKSFEGVKGLRVSSEVGKLSKGLLDSKYELIHQERYGKEVTVKEHVKVIEHVVDCSKAAEVVVQESQIYRSGGLNPAFNSNQELIDDRLQDEEYMEAPEEYFEESHLNNGNVKGKADRTKQGAEELAIRLLGKRAVTAVELRKKLIAKHFPLNIVEAVLRDVQNRGLINDGLYAETYTHSRWESSSWGPRRIKQALTKKGVSAVHVEKAVKLVFEDYEEGDQRSSIRLSSASLHQLYIKASKQWQRSQNVPYETRKARVIRWLQYRGFDWSVIGTIMKKLESE